MGPWMSLVRPWTGPTGCSHFGRSKRPQQVHVLFAQQKEVLAQRPVTRKKSRHIHSTKRICLGSRPLSSCLHRYEMWWNMMEHDEMWWNVMKFNIIQRNFRWFLRKSLPWSSMQLSLSSAPWSKELQAPPSSPQQTPPPLPANHWALLYGTNSTYDLWWIIMNQWIMNLCLPLIGQPLEARRMLSDSCSRTALFAGMGKVSRPTCPDEIQSVIRMATDGHREFMSEVMEGDTGDTEWHR